MVSFLLRLKILGGLEGFIISLVFNSTASLLLGYKMEMKLIKSNIFFEIFTINCREMIKAISFALFRSLIKAKSNYSSLANLIAVTKPKHKKYIYFGIVIRLITL